MPSMSNTDNGNTRSVHSPGCPRPGLARIRLYAQNLRDHVTEPLETLLRFWAHSAWCTTGMLSRINPNSPIHNMEASLAHAGQPSCRLELQLQFA